MLSKKTNLNWSPKQPLVPLGESLELHTHCVTALNPNQTLKWTKVVHYPFTYPQVSRTRNRAFSICLDSSNLGPLYALEPHQYNPTCPFSIAWIAQIWAHLMH
jgi:hypothetical protein